MNLNKIDIKTDGYPQSQVDHSTTSGNVRVVFKDLSRELVTLIRRDEVDAVVGCVAWLTHPKGPDLEGVRCVGVGGQRNRPRMHDKFLVFCKEEPECASDVLYGSAIKPFAVWTGSFNFTRNATQSFENAVYIEDVKIARAYFDEFQQIAALSEPLDWESEYVEPEWRIGS